MHPDFSYYLARARIADLLRPAQPGLRHAGHLRQFHRDRRPLHHATGTRLIGDLGIRPQQQRRGRRRLHRGRRWPAR
jgi:hypothetical protein